MLPTPLPRTALGGQAWTPDLCEGVHTADSCSPGKSLGCLPASYSEGPRALPPRQLSGNQVRPQPRMRGKRGAFGVCLVFQRGPSFLPFSLLLLFFPSPLISLPLPSFLLLSFLPSFFPLPSIFALSYRDGQDLMVNQTDLVFAIKSSQPG